jgi:NADPH:quinone reductase-like Zn-dependent oxidoreductase
VQNNWQGNKKGDWDWENGKEVVVVTGGSDGIGMMIVKMLAERGVRIAVLDVQGLTYEGMLAVSFLVD